MYCVFVCVYVEVPSTQHNDNVGDNNVLCTSLLKRRLKLRTCCNHLILGWWQCINLNTIFGYYFSFYLSSALFNLCCRTLCVCVWMLLVVKEFQSYELNKFRHKYACRSHRGMSTSCHIFGDFGHKIANIIIIIITHNDD